MQKIENKSWTVDMDQEMKRQPKKDKSGQAKPDVHRVNIKLAGQGKPVPMQSLVAFLNGQADYDERCLEATSKSTCAS